jgi:putative tryptophan/tyrosine transport system substrate-binding protein
MRRRDFIAGVGGVVAWPLAARAQQAKRVIGYLSAGLGPATGAEALVLGPLWQGLNEAGYVEGRNVEILFRFAEYQLDRLPSLALDLVRNRVAAIVAFGGAPALTAKAATSTIPIVFMTATDPVAIGLVARLDRPGGNLTGAGSHGEAYSAKGIEFVHELVPGASSIAALTNPANPIDPLRMTEVYNAARTLGLRLTVLNASNPEEIEQAFAIVAQERPGGLFVDTDAVLFGQTDQIVTLAARYRVPTVYGFRDQVQAGGLMSYAGSVTETGRIAATYVARIFNGEKPGDLPVQLGTRIELAINLKTAKALGLTIPPNLLARADQVIE